MTDLMTRYGDFPNGVSIRDMSVLAAHSGKVFWVHSSSGGDGNEGTFDRPLATVDAAINKCTASKGDIVVVKAGHAETISAAGTITLDKIGVKVLCLGEGANRPTFTFSATASTILVSAASCTWIGGVMTPSIDSVVTAFQVEAADFTVDTNIQDASATVEFVRGLLTTTAGNRLKARIKYDGNVGGNACVNAVRLVGADSARIHIDFYGIASTAVVEFVTTACTDVAITGYVFNSGTTDGSKNVIDTVSGSTWFAALNDGAAGAAYSGGSAASLAQDDISAITAALHGGAGIATWPTAAAYGNGISIAEVLAYIQDGTRKGSGTALATNESLADVLYAANGIVTFPAAAAPANGVSLAEVIRSVYDAVAADGSATTTVHAHLGRRVTKVATLASDPDDLFTVTGKCLVTLMVGECTSVIATSTSLSLNTSTNSIVIAASTDIVGDAAGALYIVTGDPDDGLNGQASGADTNVDVARARTGHTAPFMINDDNIYMNLDGAGTGLIQWDLYYVPLEAGASIASSA